MGKRLAFFGAILLAGFVLTVSARLAFKDHFLLGDFRAFYCAGSAVLHHTSPYGATFIRTCEATPAGLRGLFTAAKGEILPSPVPGYVAAAFLPFALLPYPVAAAVYVALTLLVLGLAMRTFREFGLAPPATIIVALSILMCDVTLPVGELPPFALLGIALLCVGLRSHRSRLVIVGTALAMFEPQIGIAIVIVLVMTRAFAVEAAVTCVVLALISLAAIGLHANFEYVRVVLPQHVLSELPSINQYTISWAVAMLGGSDGFAIGLTRVTYALSLLGIAVLATTPFARQRTDIAVLCAPAVAMIGAPFVHLDHLLLAIPAAFALAELRQNRWVATIIACALAESIVRIFVAPVFLSVALVIAATVAWTIYRRPRPVLVAVALSFAYITLCAILILKTGLDLRAAPLTHTLRPTQEFWAIYVRHHWEALAWPLWLIKAPPWVALVLTTITYAVACFRSRVPKKLAHTAREALV